MNLLKKSNLTKDKAKKILKGTALEDCSDYFIECEEKYGVNAIGVMAIAVHESAWEQVEELRKIIILPDTAFTVILQKELMLHPKKRIY